MGNRLSKRLHSLSNRELSLILTKIAKVDEFKGWWKGASRLSPQILGRLKRSIVVTSAGASTRIEGSQLSDKEVEKLLSGLRVNKLKDRDSQEVAGYAEVLRVVFDSYRDIAFSEGVILQFHRELLKYSTKDENLRGQYKRSPNKVVAFDEAGGENVLFNPTEPHLTPSKMRELVEWTKEQLAAEEFHPLLVIANFILEFLAIHPFHDGNGRLSRILTNLLLAQAGYAYVPYASLEKIIEDHKVEYYLALREGQKDIKSETAKVAKWILFFVETMIRQTEVLSDFLKGTPDSKILSPNQQRTMKLFDQHEEITNKMVAEELKIPAVSAKQILNRLIELTLIERLGAGRATRYAKRKEG